jgi:Tol biopolymer transport system component
LLPNAFANIPRWSADGSQIAFVGGGPPEQAGSMPAGVYVIPAAGGAPRLLQANDKVDPANPSADARGYSPVAWSPDGTKLLLSAYSMTVETCSAAIKDVSTGTLTPIQAPEELVAGCASGRWSPDGKLIYTTMARPGPQPPVPGLWTVDPQTGASTPFLQGQFENGLYQLVTNYRPLEDGSVYAFVAEVETLPDPFGGVFPAYQLTQRSQTDGLVLREEPLVVTGQALWAPDNSGVIVDLVQPASTNGVVTAWVPISGGPVVELGPFMGEAKQWVRE